MMMMMDDEKKNVVGGGQIRRGMDELMVCLIGHG